MKKKFSTICSYCGVGCGINISKSRDGSIQLSGNNNYPVNKGMLCSKGMNLHHVVEDKSDRLIKPMGRFDKDHPLKELTWDQAMKRAAAVFKTLITKYGSNSVGLYVSGQLLTEEYYVANKLCKGFLGTNNIDTNSRLCMSSAVVGYKKSLGDDAVPISYDDIEASDCFLVSGANPAWCHPILFRRLEAQLKSNSNAILIVIDPRKTETAQIAHIHLQLKVGTDVELYNAMAAILLEKGCFDYDFLDKHINGAEQLIDFLKNIDVKESANICEIALEDIYKACEMIAQRQSLLTFWAMGLNQSSVGVDKNLALINLNLITGRIGKEGSGPFSLTGQPNAMGGREVGGLANLLAAHRDLADEKERQYVANFWGVDKIDGQVGLSATEMIDAIEKGSLKALWVICTNPIVSLPNRQKVDKALRKIPFLMVSEISNLADTIAYADLVLPAAGWLEKEGTMTNSERRISYLPKVVEPPGEALPDSEIICHFSKEMGFGDAFKYANTEEIFNEHRELTKGTNIDIGGVSYDLLKKHSVQWPCPEGNSTGTKRLFTANNFWTANKKANVFCVEYKASKEKTSKQFPFLLTTGRVRDQWHTMTRTGKVKKLHLHISRPYLEMNPYDAKRLGLGNNNIVIVNSLRASVESVIKLSDEIKIGTLFLPMHWQASFNQGKSCVNDLTSDLIDSVSKQPEFKLSAVNVQRAHIKNQRLVIIGAGAAALEFIHKYREVNTTDELIVYGKESLDFYNRILLPEYLNGESQWQDLTTADKQSLSKKNIIFHQGVLIIDIDKDKRIITTSQGLQDSYDKLIIATGSSPIIPVKTHKRLEGVFALRTRQDADNIRRYIQDNKSAVIIGGGLLGLELAGALASMGVKVTIIQRSARLMRGQLDELAGKILHEEILDRNIDVIYNEEVLGIFGDGQVEYITLSSGKQIKCQSLFFAIGIKSNIEIGQKAGIKCSRGIIVNEWLQTSDENIYAMGEVAEREGKIYGTTAAAQQQARILVNIIRDDHSSFYKGSLNFNILKIRDLELCSIGLVSAPDETYEEVKIVDKKLRYYKKCIIKNDRLVGALLIGNKSEFSEFKKLIEDGYELGDKRQTLLRNTSSSQALLGKLVCVCNNVGKGNISAVLAQGCDNFEEVCYQSKAGTGCGSCRPEIKKIMDEARNCVNG